MSYFNHEFFRVLLDTLPTQQSIMLRSFIENDDVLGLTSQSVDRSGEILFEDVFFKELFRKVSDAPLGIDTAAVAVSSFLEVELENSVTNSNIVDLSSLLLSSPNSELSQLICRVQRQIRKILGPVPERLSPSITIGATVDKKRNRTVFSSLVKPSVTFDCVTYLRASGLVRSNYKLMSYPKGDNPCSPFGSVVDDFVYFPGAKLETVPKTAYTDRVIAKEPTVNIAYQGAVGKVISKRLSLFGLDIPTRADLHKTLARSGSITGLLATIDLSAASDRIVRELVRLLLPNDWYILLDSLRSKKIQIQGTSHDLQMFSTAGNGFTFELETLIFYSVALCCTLPKGIYNSAPHDVSVFGDDIIIPSCYFDNFLKISKVFGFVVNFRKSFNTGLFRESCGGDYYNGIDVRGYNAKALPQTPNQWISIANAIRRVCFYNNGNSWRGRWSSDLWHRVILCIPEDFRLFGPRHYGDTCINCEYTNLYSIRSNKWRGETIKVHAPAGGEFTSVGREISDIGVSGDLAHRLVIHESIRGKGYAYKKQVQEDGSTLLIQAYPYSLLTSTVGIHYRNKWIPYTLYGQAPDELPDLISSLTNGQAQFLRTPRQVVARNVIKRRELVLTLVNLLSNISQQKAERVRMVESKYQSISFNW